MAWVSGSCFRVKRSNTEALNRNLKKLPPVETTTALQAQVRSLEKQQEELRPQLAGMCTWSSGLRGFWSLLKEEGTEEARVQVG